VTGTPGRAPDVRPACDLIGHEGRFRLPGGRTVYEAVLYDEATARGARPRLARLETAGGLRQVNRWVDWDQPVEVIAGPDDQETGPAGA
jgi:hypothetical protein